MHSSRFAALLKQSKFASFDPLISQVYASHGGNAHRGDWGFKRPLPVRRRGAYITVKGVDTKEHQTDWNSAEPQALWIKNWDELKLTPSPVENWPCSPQEHLVDSDYVPKTSPDPLRQSYIPNIETMTRREFAGYLHKIRARRNAFLEQCKAEDHPDHTSYQLINLSKPSTRWHDLFAAHDSERRRTDPRDTEIEHVPHASGGLTYPHYSPLQTFLMTKERKGRLADEARHRDKSLQGYVASFARMGGRVLKRNAGMEKPIVWDDPTCTGEVMIRPQKAVVNSWPMVVKRRQGLKAARVDMDLRVWQTQSHFRSNPHWPGSREYIAAEPPRTVEELRQSVVSRMDASRTRTGRNAISLLRLAMGPSTPSS